MNIETCRLALVMDGCQMGAVVSSCGSPIFRDDDFNMAVSKDYRSLLGALVDGSIQFKKGLVQLVESPCLYHGFLGVFPF